MRSVTLEIANCSFLSEADMALIKNNTPVSDLWSEIDKKEAS